MKVLYVTHESGLNGASKSLLEMLAGIREMGVDPIVVIPTEGKLRKELAEKEIDTRIVPYSVDVYEGKIGFRGYVRYYRKNTAALMKILRIIRNEKIAVVHSNSLAVDIGAAAACVAGVPHVWHCREYLEEDFNYKLVNPRLDRRLIRKSACCIAISEGIAEKMKRTYGVQAVQLYDALDRTQYYAPIDDGRIKYRGRLLIAGSICEAKGQWDAIRAAEILKKGGVDFHLHVVGDGNAQYINQLEQYVEKHGLQSYVTLMPYDRNLQKLRLESDIVLVCSRMEAFGRVTAEAMLAGKIVVGAATGGTAELIGKQEERGYLYAWNDPKELADKIKYVTENPDEVYEKEKKAQDYILELTNPDAYASQFIKIYRRIL